MGQTTHLWKADATIIIKEKVYFKNFTSINFY